MRNGDWERAKLDPDFIKLIQRSVLDFKPDNARGRGTILVEYKGKQEPVSFEKNSDGGNIFPVMDDRILFEARPITLNAFGDYLGHMITGKPRTWLR